MSIKKFLSIKFVGRFVNCTQKGPELNRCNLFYAENGRGKTTLCAILRSLQTGQPEFILERKTIAPIIGDSFVSLRLDSGNATFGKNGWSVTVPDIAIFDATFVARNVHAGEYVDRDHRSNLLQIIVGEAGVSLAEKVNTLDEEIRQRNSEIGKSRKALQALVPAGTKLDDFLALAVDPDIDAKITGKAAERDAAKRADDIKTRKALVAVALPTLPANLLTVLGKTLSDVSADADKRLKDQIAHHNMHEHGEAWISEGLSYLHNNTCPFCGQDTNGLPLVDAYKQYFSEAYNDLIAEIDGIRADVEATLGEAALATIGQTIATNETSVQFWSPFIGIAVGGLDHETVTVPAVRQLREAVTHLLDLKKATPLASIAPDARFKLASETFDKAEQVVAAYNTVISSANVAVAEQKEKAKAANLALVESELASLSLVKLRRDQQLEPLCTEYLALTSGKDKLDKDKEAAKDALDKHSGKMIVDYETTINKFLKGFGAGFSITNSKKTYVGGTPSSAYQILINNQPVDLGDASTPPGVPCFRTTLSAGDKSTLALAFFLAQLDHDPKKAQQIVVFDDPFNSQDRSRRERTAELLKKYGKECAQLLLLSHDPFFLSLVYSKLPKTERHTLQLTRAPDNTTTIEEWDVEKETQDGYFKDHAALSSYLLNGAKDLIDIARKIRPVLEGYHRYRFPHQFPDNEWLGDMIKRVRNSSGAHPMHPALEDLEGINDYSKKYHHDTNPGKADSEPINDGELQGYVQRTLTIVGGY